MDWGEEAWGFVQDDGGILAQTSSSVRDLSSTAHRTPEERAQRGLGVDADNDKGDEDRLVNHQLDPPWSTKKTLPGFKDHNIAFWSRMTESSDTVGEKLLGLHHGRAPKARFREFPYEKNGFNPIREYPLVNVRANERQDHQVDQKQPQVPADVDKMAERASERDQERRNGVDELLASEIEEVEFALDQVLISQVHSQRTFVIGRGVLGVYDLCRCGVVMKPLLVG